MEERKKGGEVELTVVLEGDPKPYLSRVRTLHRDSSKF